MNEDQPLASPIHPPMAGERPARIYPIRYVSRTLIKAVWILLAITVVSILLSVDLSSGRVPEPLSTLEKNLLVIFAMAFLAIVLVISFYKKKADIRLDEKGIRFPNGDILPWRSIDWYKISVYSDRYGLKRTTFKAREGYKVRMIVEDGNQMAALEEDIKETLERYNSSA